MRKIKTIIGLTSIIICFLIFVQTLVVSIYYLDLNGSPLEFSSSYIIGILFFISGLNLFFDRDSHKDFISIIIIFTYVICGLLGLKFLNLFNNNIFFSSVSFIYAIILTASILLQHKSSKIA